MNNTWTPLPGTTGLIFDCDGTLADTMPAHYKAWTAMLDGQALLRAIRHAVGPDDR